MSRSRRGKSRILIAAAVGCLVPLFVMSDSGAAPTDPAVSIRVESIKTELIPINANAGDAASAAIYVAKGVPFTIEATGRDANGVEAPLATNRTVTVTVKVYKDNGPSAPTLLETLDPISVEAGVKRFTKEEVTTKDLDNVFIRLETVEKKRTDPTRSGDSGLFDTQTEVNQSDAAAVFDLAIGGTVTGTNCEPNTAKPMCFEIHIPAGAATDNHVASIGNCTSTLANGCRTDLDYWWSILDVNADPNNPAYTDIGLDKSLKGLGGVSGVSKLKIVVRPSGSETWVEAPACQSKGIVTVDGEIDFCQDFAASHRDNSGDTWLRLYWLTDIRGALK